MNREKLERGKQLGISKRIQKEEKFFWYSYAIQKMDNIYYVYEYEIAEENMAMEEYEYESINKYQSFEEVLQNFSNKYGISIEDIAPLKGQRIFNVKLYI